MALIDALRLQGSTLVKQQVLKQHSTDLWKKAFYYCYHPDMQFGISRLTDEFHDIGEPNEAMFKLLDQLRNREITGNAAVDTVKDFMDEHGSLIALICRKDLNCGISAVTLNKVFGDNFIPKFSVQLAKEVPINKVFYPIVGQIKYDGVRVIAMVDTYGVKLRTRNGKSFKFPALEKVLADLYDEHNVGFMLDGELVITEGKSSDRTSISGTVNSAIHGTPITACNIRYTCFDAMPLDDFNRSKCDMVYAARYDMLKRIVTDKAYIVEVAPYFELNNPNEANEKFAEVVAQGFEGLILKKWHHRYTFKRSADWIKIKEIKDATLKCTGIQYGRPGTKYADAIGGLICEGVVEGKSVDVVVGSGLSDDDRYINDPVEVFCDKLVDVKYNSVIQDRETGKWSLFLPRFVCIRGDM